MNNRQTGQATAHVNGAGNLEHADGTNLDNQTLLCDAPMTFQRVANAAPLKGGSLAVIGDNLRLGANRQRKEQTLQEGLTALYVRLSNDDKNEGESNSIANQKKILERYCKEHGYTALRRGREDLHFRER